MGKTGGGPERLPAQLSQVNLNAAGIDVGATSHFVAVPQDRAEPPVHEFAAFTADLYRLADWLAESEVETVVMESTGVYWIPLFGVLEERGFEVMLVDPRRIKNVPGLVWQDRRAGLPVAAATAHLWPAVGSLPTRRGHTTPAQLSAAAGHAGGVRIGRATSAWWSHPAYAEGLDPDEREAPSSTSFMAAHMPKRAQPGVATMVRTITSNCLPPRSTANWTEWWNNSGELFAQVAELLADAAPDMGLHGLPSGPLAEAVVQQPAGTAEPGDPSPD